MTPLSTRSTPSDRAHPRKDPPSAESGVWSENIRRSWNSDRSRAEKDDSGGSPVSKGADAGNWIHRDKLARIESEELQQAALLFSGRGNRERSHDGARQQLRSSPGLDDQNDGAADDGMDEGEEDDQKSRASAELRDDGAAAIYSNPGLRKSSSRIPIPSSPSSRLPLSSSAIGSPVPQRTRGLCTGSDTAREDNSPASRPGSRPGSNQASPAKKQKENNSSPPTPSPRKASTPGAGRKKSVSKGRNQPASNNATRSRSQSQSHSRPTTRSGENRSTNSPEGDPPWLVNMYKPDPRLPPDQQILPTHARRMQQEQWEKEGKTPIMYDREFAPLAITPDRGESAKVESKPAEEHESNEKIERHTETEEAARPSPPATDKPLPKRPESNSSPPMNPGYRTVPKIRNPPVIMESPRLPLGTTASAVAAPQEKQPEPQSEQEQPAHRKKSKAACACCVVM